MKQKDAGVKEFVSANITYLLKTYTDLNDDQIREIVWKIMLAANDLATEARQQAFQECLEAVGNDEDEDKLKIPVGSSPFYSAERIRYEAVAIQNRNATRKKIRANIEKLMK
jgi:hypothetical protein